VEGCWDWASAWESAVEAVRARAEAALSCLRKERREVSFRSMRGSGFSSLRI
jgi:hypothetical protein